MRNTSYRFHILAALVAGVLVSHTSHSGQVPVLPDFNEGTPAKAADVNGHFNAITKEVNTNDTRLGTVESSSADHETRIKAVENTNDTQTVNLNALGTTVTGNTMSINTLNTTTSGHTTSINSLNTTTSNHTTSINTLNSTTGNNTTSIGTINTNLAALQAATVAFLPLNSSSSMRADCKAILGANESKGNGLYYIHPGTTTYLAHCDMTTQGGGWTLVMNVHPSDGSSVSFTNTKFWMDQSEYGEIGAHFSNDYKSPAAWEIASTNIMVEVAKPGINGSIIGYKAWDMSIRSFDSFFDVAQNTTLTSSVIGSNVTNVYAYEPIIKNGTNLQANRNINLNGDRVRLGVDGYTTGDDNQPGLGTQMNETSCGVGINCFRYRDVELWVDSTSNLWCTRPVPSSYAFIGRDGGCGDQCGGCDAAKGTFSEIWTYRIYIR